MNTFVLLSHMPTSAWIGLILSVVIPAASAALVKAHWDASITGILTLGLATATGFFTEWAHAGDGFRWQTALSLALVSWIVAALSQSKILSGTQLEAFLLSIGSRLNLDQYDDPDDVDDASDPTLSLEDEPDAVTPADLDQPAAGDPPSVSTGATGTPSAAQVVYAEPAPVTAPAAAPPAPTS